MSGLKWRGRGAEAEDAEDGASWKEKGGDQGGLWMWETKDVGVALDFP